MIVRARSDVDFESEQAETIPECQGVNSTTVLDTFAYNRSTLTAGHQRTITQVARCIVASLRTPTPINNMDIVGHADRSGTDQYNLRLGRRRATAVANALRAAIDRIRSGASTGIVMNVSSAGETRPIRGSAPRSRRVEIFMRLPSTPPPPPRRRPPPAPLPTPPPAPPARPRPFGCGQRGLRQIRAGILSRNAVLRESGGQVMVLEIRNLNVIPVNVSISAHGGRPQSQAVMPNQTRRFRFTMFGVEPMGWEFRIRLGSPWGRSMVGVKICTNWSP